MVDSQINNIISNVVLSSKPCSKLLVSDGISSNIFMLRDFDNKKLVSFKDVRPLRNNVPQLGLAININDNNFFKIKFQKIRILIHLFFYGLAKIIADDFNPSSLNEWVKGSNALLMETSDLVLEYRDCLKGEKDVDSTENFAQKVKLKQDYFNYFDTGEENMDNRLYSIYGIES
jgi:hypothetical protein